MRARVFLGLLPLLAPFVAAGAAVAQPAQPLDRLLPQIRRNVPGQFLDAEGAGPGNSHYHLKWLTPDGRVMWLDADARTGRVLGQSPGRDGFDTPRPRSDDRPRSDEQGGPPDRREEGRSTNPRDDRAEQPRFDNRRQFGNGGDDRGGRPERNFGNRFERGPGGNDRNFGGRDFGGRPDFGNRGGGNDRGFGGGRDRRGNGR